MENYKLQKMLMQLSRSEETGNDEETKKIEEQIYNRISEMQIELFLTSIESIQFPEGMVEDEKMIDEWIRNSDRSFFKIIKDKLETNKAQWDIPSQSVTCTNCGHESQAEITMDQANFFDRG